LRLRGLRCVILRVELATRSAYSAFYFYLSKFQIVARFL
jgi:hypothetical protein